MASNSPPRGVPRYAPLKRLVRRAGSRRGPNRSISGRLSQLNLPVFLEDHAVGGHSSTILMGSGAGASPVKPAERRKLNDNASKGIPIGRGRDCQTARSTPAGRCPGGGGTPPAGLTELFRSLGGARGTTLRNNLWTPATFQVDVRFWPTRTMSRWAMGGALAKIRR